jgi:inorganic phosphate transporter, PiT family
MLISFLFISANGANDKAGLFGSGITSYRLALTWAALMIFDGSIPALFLVQLLMVKFLCGSLFSSNLIYCPFNN